MTLVAVAVVTQPGAAVGPGAVTVPDLKGLTYEAAGRRLREAGLVIRAVDPWPEAEVDGQLPAAGTRVPRETEVWVSFATAAVPDVVGQPLDATERQLAQAGLRASVKGAGAFPPEDYRVIAQEPSAGQTVKKGTAVHLAVRPARSTGP
jgi:eukaryotic-like serine/threonine-protein kinase